MQAVNRFVENYVEPVVNHPVSRLAFKLIVEVVQIIAIKVFLGYVGMRFLSHSPRISKTEIYETTVLAPIVEEIVFRFVVLRGIHLVQSLSNRMTSSEEDSISLPGIEGIVGRVYIHGVYLIGELTNFVLTRLHLNSIFSLEGQEKMTKKEKMQKISRIHLAAFIFAAAHLNNEHPNRTSALIQFSWTFLGGIIYGHLTEKYHSLAPGMLIHGLNNSLSLSARVYPTHAHFLVLALLINRVASYILAVTSIDKVIMSAVRCLA